jgi:hypothetical protein
MAVPAINGERGIVGVPGARVLFPGEENDCHDRTPEQDWHLEQSAFARVTPGRGGGAAR